MHTLSIQWKEFNIALWLVEEFCYANAGPHFTHLDATPQELKVVYTQEPDKYNERIIAQYIAKLTRKSPEAYRYVTAATIREKHEEIVSELLAKDWVNLTKTEKKIIIGMEITPKDLGF